MVYEGTQALIYLKNYVTGTDQWDGFPIKVRYNYNSDYIFDKPMSMVKLIPLNNGLGWEICDV